MTKEEKVAQVLNESIMTILNMYGVSTEEAMSHLVSAAVSCMWMIAERENIEDPKGLIKKMLQSAIEATEQVEV